ncbi:hypothetical protein GCM10027342_02370 [Photobacterium alginatilyticum]
MISISIRREIDQNNAATNFLYRLTSLILNVLLQRNKLIILSKAPSVLGQYIFEQNDDKTQLQRVK